MSASNDRRRACILIAGGLLSWVLGGVMLAELTPTPRTGVGPYYPIDDTLPIDNDLTRKPGATGTARGETLRISGRVIDTGGRQVEGAEVVIWQTDLKGRYDHPREPKKGKLDPHFQYWGKARTDSYGSFSFTTIVPGQYEVGGRPRPNHVHFTIRHSDYRSLATEMHFAGDPRIEKDFVTSDLSRDETALLAVEVRSSPGEPKLVHFQIVLEQRADG